LAAVLVLLAYVFVGCITGFGPGASGHMPLEMVHLPNASRDTGTTGGLSLGHVLPGDDDAGIRPANAGRQMLDPPSAAAPPNAISIPVATTDFVQFVSLVVLGILAATAIVRRPFGAERVTTASPAWWLRTVVLHL
jgi:hypothetical protein